MKAKTATSQISQPEVGTHMARLVGIVDLGLQPAFEYQGKEVKAQYKLRFTYELPNSTMEDGRPHWVHEDVTNSDNDKSTLSMRVRTLDGSFDSLTGMIGNPCMVTVVEGNKGYVKIDGQGGIGGIPAGIAVGELTNPTFIFDQDEPDLDVYDSLPEFIQNRIKEGDEYRGSSTEIALLQRDAQGSF